MNTHSPMHSNGTRMGGEEQADTTEKSVRCFRMGMEEKDGYKRKVRASALCYLIAMHGEGVWAGDTGELDTTLVRSRRSREMSTCEEKPWRRQSTRASEAKAMPIKACPNWYPLPCKEGRKTVSQRFLS